MECTRQRLIRAIMLWRANGQRANAGRTPAVYRFALVVVFASLLALAPTPRPTALGEEPPVRAKDPPASAHVEASPAEPTSEQIQAWINQLGDDDFQTRERAQKELVKAGNPAYFALDSLAPSDDPEVKLRVELALNALEDDAAAQLRKLGASVLKRDGAEHWNYVATKTPETRDEDLKPLMRLKHVENLRLDEGAFTDNALDYCQHLTELRHFASYHTNISDAGLEKVAQFRDLESIGLLLPKMTNKGFAAIATLPKLRYLTVFDARIDGDGLAHLLPLKEQLEVLQLEGTLISDDDLIHLKDFSELRSLRLSRTRVTGEGLRHISDLPQLESLLLTRLDLSEAAFVQIAKLRHLKHVYLNDSGITSKDVLALRDSSSLTLINVSKQEFTKDEIDAIKQKFAARGIGVKTSISRN